MSMCGFHRAALPFALLAALAGCGDDDASPTDPGTNGTIAEQRGTIDAAGGTISAPNGSFVLTIPAGALASETTIVVRELEPIALAQGTAWRSFTFEPADLTFSADVVLDVDVPTEFALRGTRSLRAALPVVQLTREDLADPRPASEILDYVAHIDYGDPTAITVGVPIRGFGPDGSVVSVSEIAPAAGQPSFDFAILSSESHPDQIDDAALGTTIRIETRTSVPPFFAPSPSEAAVLLAGTVELVAAALTPGSELPELDAGIDNLGRFSRTLGVDVAVGTELQNGTTARFGYGIRSQWSVDLTTYLDRDEPTGFDVTFEENFAPLAFPVNVTDPPMGYTIGVRDVGAGVEGGAFFDAVEGWTYQAGQTWAVSDAVRLLDAAFGELEPDLDATAPIGAYVGALRNETPGGAAQGITLFSYGANYFGLTSWDAALQQFGFTQVIPTVGNVTDSAPYGNDPLSGGVHYVDNTSSWVRLLEYDGQGWNVAGTISDFPQATGAAIAAFRRPGADALIAIDGAPGQLYRNSVMPASSASTLIGALGDGPRCIRAIDELAIVSLFGSGALQPIVWTMEGSVTILPPVPVGDGPITFDLRPLGNGNVLAISAGYNDDTAWLTEFTSTGSVVSNRSMDLPLDVRGPGHALFVPGDGGLFAISGNTTGTVGIFDANAMN